MHHIKALLITPGQPPQIITVDTSDQQALSTLLDHALLEAVFPSHSWHAYVDEEGKLKGLPVNKLATNLIRSALPRFSDVIAGPAVFLGTNGHDEDHVPDHVIHTAHRLHRQDPT